MPIEQPFTDADCEIVAREPLYQGFFRLERYRVRHRLFAGGWTDTFQREVFVRHEAAVVMLFDPARDVVVMIEQFRAPAVGKVANPWLLELVAGLVDKDNESPDDVARREAVEEAGCDILALLPIARYLPSPGACDELVHLYLGLVDSEGVGGIHGLPDEHEDIRVHCVTVAEVRALLESGRINNAATLIAVQWLLLNRTRIPALAAAAEAAS
ncbi:MAG TPA: NUDIX domain-containing protein [Immundisolibacter sp.]